MYSKNLTILLSIVASTGLQCCSLSDCTTERTPSSLVATAQVQPGVRGKVPFEEQSRILVENLSKGKFSEIEQTLIEGIDNSYITRGGSYYSHAVLAYSFDTYSDYLDDNWLNALNAWVQESPSSSLAYTARAYFHYYYGWKFRGNRYISKTPPQAVEAYQNQVSLSLRDTEKALELDPTNPLALQNMLTIARNFTMSRDVFEEYFQRVNEQVPFFLHAYQEKAIYLDPRWHGSEQEVFAFVRKAVKTAPRGTAIPLILVQAHAKFCHRYPDRIAYYARPGVWAEVEENYQRLLEDFPESGVYAMWFSEAAEDAGRDDLSRKYMMEALLREPNNPKIQARARSLGISN